MKILHTADWHIGQLFFEYDRTFEHLQFLHWLTDTITQKQIDVLLISGDVFDLSNPSAVSVKMFYSFLNEVTKSSPLLQVIVTAGNHDSASRLESPKPLLESSNIHIIGLVDKNETGAIDYSKITIPLKGKNGSVEAWCIAAPFLRMGDYPAISHSTNTYTDGVAMFYKEAFEYAAAQQQNEEAIIAMGHLHAQQAEVNGNDKTERAIMGGVESIAASAFHENIAYVALGHIHKAQRIGGKEHIRYCGSPLPMSFSEINYKHQVIVFEISKGLVVNINSIQVPVSVSLLRVPELHSSLPNVLHTIAKLSVFDGELFKSPYLEVRVLLEEPEPGLRHKIETALIGKNIRLAKIDVRYKSSSPNQDKSIIANTTQLHDLEPLDIFRKVYQNKYNNSVPKEMLKLFQQVTQHVNENEASL